MQHTRRFNSKSSPRSPCRSGQRLLNKSLGISGPRDHICNDPTQNMSAFFLQIYFSFWNFLVLCPTKLLLLGEFLKILKIIEFDICLHSPPSQARTWAAECLLKTITGKCHVVMYIYQDLKNISVATLFRFYTTVFASKLFCSNTIAIFWWQRPDILTASTDQRFIKFT